MKIWTYHPQQPDDETIIKAAALDALLLVMWPGDRVTINTLDSPPTQYQGQTWTVCLESTGNIREAVMKMGYLRLKALGWQDTNTSDAR